MRLEGLLQQGPNRRFYARIMEERLANE